VYLTMMVTIGYSLELLMFSVVRFGGPQLLIPYWSRSVDVYGSNTQVEKISAFLEPLFGIGTQVMLTVTCETRPLLVEDRPNRRIRLVNANFR
jgi:hypothetical protein